MTFNAAKLYVNAMVMSHLTYCLTSWGHTNASTLKPLETLYKQTLKVLDQKPNSSYYCTILHKHKLLSWEDVIKHRNICLLFKILHGFAPPPLNSLINQRSTFQINRSTTRGDLSIPQKKSTFGQLSFSVKAIHNWNSLRTHIKYILHFYSQVKNMACRQLNLHTLTYGCVLSASWMLPVYSVWCLSALLNVIVCAVFILSPSCPNALF